MQFVDFEQANLILAENQPEYIPLPVNLNPEIPEKPMCFCVQLSPVDIGRLKQNGGKLFFNQLTFGKAFQPVSIGFDLPETKSELTKEGLIFMLQSQAEAAKKMEADKSKLPITLVLTKMPEGEEKLLPQLPNGSFIPNIVKDSLSLSTTPLESKAGLARLKMEVFIHLEDLKDLNLVKFPGNIEFG